MVQVLLADSYLELREWKLAENLYRQILQQRKQVSRARQVSEMVNSGGSELASETDLRYKLHQCYSALGQSNQASVLHYHWSSSNEARLSLVRVLLRQQSYAIKKQLG